MANENEYVNTVCLLKMLSSSTDKDRLLLAKILELKSYVEGMPYAILLVSHTKKKICQELNFTSVASVDKSLHKLVNAKILIRHGTGFYQLNPYLFEKSILKTGIEDKKTNDN